MTALRDSLPSAEGAMCIFALTSSAVFYPTPKGSDGLRTKKTVNGTTTEYTYASGLLVSQSDPTTTLNFTYSADGIPRSVTYGESQYYYFYNLQGDVVAIYDSQGSTQVEYTYDTWGKLLSVTGTMASTLGAKNPFRYRGYVYDTETGYYYLTTRYYDPETGRFLNADGYISTGETLTGYNMFVYCCDNPVRYKDDTGNRRTDAINSQLEGKDSDDVRRKYFQEQKKVVDAQPKRIGSVGSKGIYMVKYKIDAAMLDESSIIITFNNSETNPSYQVANSYSIISRATRVSIFDAIRNYEKQKPTLWSTRTNDSMLLEWDLHTLGYFVLPRIDRLEKTIDRLKHVDLDYESEEKTFIDYVHDFLA